jgi:hypothetical protein
MRLSLALFTVLLVTTLAACGSDDGGNCSLDCGEILVVYSCATADRQIQLTFCPTGGFEVSSSRTEYENGHVVTCDLNCAGSGGTCGDDSGATCDF